MRDFVCDAAMSDLHREPRHCASESGLRREQRHCEATWHQGGFAVRFYPGIYLLSASCRRCTVLMSELSSMFTGQRVFLSVSNHCTFFVCRCCPSSTFIGVLKAAWQLFLHLLGKFSASGNLKNAQSVPVGNLTMYSSQPLLHMIVGCSLLL